MQCTYEMTTHVDHPTENPQLSFFPLATADNTVNYMHSCNYTPITNTCLSWHRGGCWKETGMKKLEDTENIVWALWMFLCTSYQNLHCVARLNSPLRPSCWNTATIEILEGSHPEDALAPVFTWCKGQNYILPMSNQWFTVSLPSR